MIFSLKHINFIYVAQDTGGLMEPRALLQNPIWATSHIAAEWINYDHAYVRHAPNVSAGNGSTSGSAEPPIAPITKLDIQGSSGVILVTNSAKCQIATSTWSWFSFTLHDVVIWHLAMSMQSQCFKLAGLLFNFCFF